jgi:hypothetical protein
MTSSAGVLKEMRRGWGALFGIPALFVLAYFYPSIPILNSLPTCGVRLFLGFDCPGCGMTRAFVSAMHGEIMESVRFHPLAPIVIIWLLYLFARELIQVLSGRRLPPLLSERARDILTYAFLAALILQWVVKPIMKWVC